MIGVFIGCFVFVIYKWWIYFFVKGIKVIKIDLFWFDEWVLLIVFVIVY